MLTDDELRSLSKQAHSSISESAMRLACLVHLGQRRFLSYRKEDRETLRGLHNLAILCVQTYAAQTGVDWSGVEAGLQALERAGAIAGYLHELPD